MGQAEGPPASPEIKGLLDSWKPLEAWAVGQEFRERWCQWPVLVSPSSGENLPPHACLLSVIHLNARGQERSFVRGSTGFFGPFSVGS